MKESKLLNLWIYNGSAGQQTEEEQQRSLLSLETWHQLSFLHIRICGIGDSLSVLGFLYLLTSVFLIVLISGTTATNTVSIAAAILTHCLITICLFILFLQNDSFPLHLQHSYLPFLEQDFKDAKGLSFQFSSSFQSLKHIRAEVLCWTCKLRNLRSCNCRNCSFYNWAKWKLGAAVEVQVQAAVEMRSSLPRKGPYLPGIDPIMEEYHTDSKAIVLQFMIHF